jgi:uncharacterized protein
MNSHHFQIRDPIHGVIFISSPERAIIDSRPFQRLRNIKQVGFLDFAFPAASHSRYCHSLGAMSFASKIFKRVIREDSLSPSLWARMHQTVRLAALLHDIGHPPLSHTTEMIMPKVCDIIPGSSSQALATHEDFTLQIILRSELASIIRDNFKDLEISPEMIASLVTHEHGEDFFVVDGVSYTPILQQIISSEIDADRMDYLLRDSLFCGVNYGKFDSDWLIENLVSINVDEQVYLGFKARAVFAFEDFLLSRYHMFASVYLHHTPVIMEKMLERFFAECPHLFSLPANLAQYVELNDIDLWQALRHSQNPWAERIVRRRPYVMVYEHINRLDNNTQSHQSYEQIINLCNNANIDTILSRSKSVLSKYFNTIKKPLYVEDTHNRAIPLEEFSSLFIKYQAPTELFRIYVAPEHKQKAAKLIENILV